MSASVLPARAGMSPNGVDVTIEAGRAPRTGGDEPATAESFSQTNQCSPHGRG